MEPTMHLRWDERSTYATDEERPIALMKHRRVLQQFWIIAAEESDITLQRERGPDGHVGRWRDVP